MTTSPPIGNRPSERVEADADFCTRDHDRAIHQPGDALEVACDRLVTERPGLFRFNNDLDHGVPAIHRHGPSRGTIATGRCTGPEVRWPFILGGRLGEFNAGLVLADDIALTNGGTLNAARLMEPVAVRDQIQAVSAADANRMKALCDLCERPDRFLTFHHLVPRHLHRKKRFRRSFSVAGRCAIAASGCARNATRAFTT